MKLINKTATITWRLGKYSLHKIFPTYFHLFNYKLDFSSGEEAKPYFKSVTSIFISDEYSTRYEVLIPITHKFNKLKRFKYYA